jgi:hypothetical protein
MELRLEVQSKSASGRLRVLSPRLAFLNISGDDHPAWQLDWMKEVSELAFPRSKSFTFSGVSNTSGASYLV